MLPVFPQVYPLPGAEAAAAAGDRQRQVGMREDRAHMGRHIIRSFRHMLEQVITIRHKTHHETLQVGSHVGVGVLAEYQRGTGVMKKQVAQAPLDTGRLDMLPNGICDVETATSGCCNHERGLVELQGVHLPLYTDMMETSSSSTAMRSS